MEAIERLGMHLALTIKLLQQGCTLTSLQAQLLTLRAATKDVMALSGPDAVQLMTILPESLAEMLAEDVVVPDDASDLEGD